MSQETAPELTAPDLPPPTGAPQASAAQAQVFAAMRERAGSAGAQVAHAVTGADTVDPDGDGMFMARGRYDDARATLRQSGTPFALYELEPPMVRAGPLQGHMGRLRAAMLDRERQVAAGTATAGGKAAATIAAAPDMLGLGADVAGTVLREVSMLRPMRTMVDATKLLALSAGGMLYGEHVPLVWDERSWQSVTKPLLDAENFVTGLISPMGLARHAGMDVPEPKGQGPAEAQTGTARDIRKTTLDAADPGQAMLTQAAPYIAASVAAGSIVGAPLVAPQGALQLGKFALGALALDAFTDAAVGAIDEPSDNIFNFIEQEAKKAGLDEKGAIRLVAQALSWDPEAPQIVNRLKKGAGEALFDVGIGPLSVALGRLGSAPPRVQQTIGALQGYVKAGGQIPELSHALRVSYVESLDLDKRLRDLDPRMVHVIEGPASNPYAAAIQAGRRMRTMADRLDGVSREIEVMRRDAVKAAEEGPAPAARPAYSGPLRRASDRAGAP